MTIKKMLVIFAIVPRWWWWLFLVDLNGEIARLRRLFHEACALVSADLKAQVEQSDDSGVRKLAAPERAKRHKQQQEKLQGIDISGASAPGDSLMDKCVAMYEADRLTYIPWSHCVSRDHEPHSGTKPDTALALDSKGLLKVNTKN